MLKLGSQGDDVKNLQMRLGITSDGVFGPKTEEALKEWQQKHGIIPDGVAGPATITRIESNNPLPPVEN